MTTAFDFGMLQSVDHEWQQRGRKPKPLPEPLLTALHESFSHESTIALPVPTDQVNSFKNLLNKCGEELNYRIHRELKEDTPAPGYTMYYFKVVGRRRNSSE